VTAKGPPFGSIGPSTPQTERKQSPWAIPPGFDEVNDDDEDSDDDVEEETSAVLGCCYYYWIPSGSRSFEIGRIGIGAEIIPIIWRK